MVHWYRPEAPDTMREVIDDRRFRYLQTWEAKVKGLEAKTSGAGPQSQFPSPGSHSTLVDPVTGCPRHLRLVFLWWKVLK